MVFPAKFNLSDLDSTNGFVLKGINPSDVSGTSVSSAGDVNADGVDDIIIGARGADPNGTTGAGETYVVFGSTGIGSTGTIELSALNGTNGFTLNGINRGDRAGFPVSSAGDVNADGIDDVIIGATGADPNGDSSGQTYVVFGSTGIGSTGTIELSTLNGTNGFALNGIDANDRSGFSVSNAGDVNADGIDDVIIGAYSADPNGGSSGQSYVVFGSTGIGSGGTIELSALNGTNGFALNGINRRDASGISVSSAGDVNGDGVDDLIIGAQGADPNGSRTGQSYVVFGSTAMGSTGTIELSALNGNNGFTLNGIDANDRSGLSVSNAGDVNADGIDDLIIGALSAAPNGSRTGQTYVVFGSTGIGFAGSIELSALNGTNGFALNGIDANDRSGVSVSSAGDVNADGIDDIIIGARGASPNGYQSGETYVVFGSTAIGSTGTIELSNLNGNNGFILNGINPGDTSGRWVSSAGDVNADGIDDIIIGANQATLNGYGSGETYVVFGVRDVVDVLDDISPTAVTQDITVQLDAMGNASITAADVDAGSTDNVEIASLSLDDTDFDGSDLGDNTVTLSVTDTSGNISTAEATVTVEDNLAPTAVAEDITVRLDAMGNASITAADIDGGSSDNVEIASLSVDDTDFDGSDLGDNTVTLTVTDTSGNISTATATVTVEDNVTSGFPAQFNLSDLDGTNGFVINGINLGDQSGFSVSSAGDVNGDGVNDIIISAYQANPNGASSGQSYVVFGSAGVGSTGTIELSALNGTNGFKLNGINTSDVSGFSVSSAGDVNGDGVDDIIISAVGADPNGGSSGQSYVVFGSTGVGSTGTIELSALNGTNGFTLNGINRSDYSGYSVSSAGDANGDGVDDIIISAPSANPNGQSSGQSYVVFGSAGIGSTGTIELSALNGTNGFALNGIDLLDKSGFSVSSAGDVNGDGVDDIIIGAPSANPDGFISGQNYVVFGSTDVGSTGTIELSALNGTNGFVINSINPGDSLSFSVSSAGDVNGDGVDDIIIGAHEADPNGFESGQSYVVFGSAGIGSTGTIELSALNGTNGFALNGIDSGDLSGFSVSSAGDVNGDGVDDLIIGAFQADPNGESSGQSYVVFGSTGIGSAGTIELSALNGTNGFALNGIDSGDLSGYSVSSARDVNGDGVDDIIIGAVGADPNGASSGQSYVVFGASDIVDEPLVTVNNIVITNEVESYGGNQDNSDTGTVTVSPSNQLNIVGNRWQKVEINSTITPNTILSFTFSGNNAEVQGIGFDNDNNIRRVDDAGHFFQVAGSQSWGIENLSQFSTIEDGKQVYTIPVGQFFTGDFDFLTFANDDDQVNPDAQAQFSNIELFEGTANLLGISINGVNQDKEILSYGGVEQNTVISSTVNDGTELELSGNSWRKIDITGFEITQSTTLEFEFRSNGTGEIQGIGFDNDNNIRSVDDSGHFFQVAGSQSWGIEDLSDYIVGSSDGFSQYSIDVGDFFTGEFDFLTFANDHDVANPTAVGEFRNISLNA